LSVVIRARPTLLAYLLCAAAATGAALAPASALHTTEAVPAAMPRGSVSMDQAVRMVEERYHARVVKAETERDAGHTLYVLRLLSEGGRVWTVRVDAASGSVQ
jgi:uncharacterized membrane protein YkoI